MPIPEIWEWALDPHELKEFVHSYASVLASEGDDVMKSQEFILPADAEVAGLEIVDQYGDAETSVGVVVLQVNEADRESELFDGEGTLFRLQHRIVTEYPRIHNRSIMLRIKRL
ncbi:hypothetical protein [Microbaculum marinum]|uniref:Uncharacterized protein n=1 Tax=Microbaculum marinum TaxID=1764581 RepID=A0AAW9RH41_9HYPH